MEALPATVCMLHRALARPARSFQPLAILVLLFFVLSVPAAAPAAAAPVPPAPAPAPALSRPTMPRVDDFGAFSVGEGWLLMDGRLYRTTRAGEGWENITPPDLGPAAIAAVHFLDPARGWLVMLSAGPDGSPHYALARTGDAGHTWRTTGLALFAPGEVAARAGALHLRFLDAQTGWLVVKRAAGSNFDLGTLFRTEDGGDTWQRASIPIGDPVSFVDRQRGWTAGGAAGDQLYRTEDGGRTWRPEALVAPTDLANPPLYQLPAFADGRRGVLPVVTGRASGARLQSFVTDDGGQTWRMAASLPVTRPVTPATRPSADAFADGQWTLSLPGVGLLRATLAGLPAQTGPGDVPAGIRRVQMVTPDAGWASYAAGDCGGAGTAAGNGGRPGTAGPCRLESRLLRTTDAGRTWQALPLPAAAAAGSPSTGEVGPLVDDSSAPANGSLSPGLPAPPASGTAAHFARTGLFTGQGFDACEAPTLPQLDGWFANSPYRAVNLYIGGLARACANTALTAAYVDQLQR